MQIVSLGDNLKCQNLFSGKNKKISSVYRLLNQQRLVKVEVLKRYGT